MTSTKHALVDSTASSSKRHRAEDGDGSQANPSWLLALPPLAFMETLFADTSCFPSVVPRDAWMSVKPFAFGRIYPLVPDAPRPLPGGRTDFPRQSYGSGFMPLAPMRWCAGPEGEALVVCFPINDNIICPFTSGEFEPRLLSFYSVLGQKVRDASLGRGLLVQAVAVCRNWTIFVLTRRTLEAVDQRSKRKCLQNFENADATDMALSNCESMLYVTSQLFDRVSVFSTDGSYLRTLISSLSQTCTTGPLERQHVAALPSGTVFMLGSKYDSTWEVLFKDGKECSERYFSGTTTDLIVDRNNVVYQHNQGRIKTGDTEWAYAILAINAQRLPRVFLDSTYGWLALAKLDMMTPCSDFNWYAIFQLSLTQIK